MPRCRLLVLVFLCLVTRTVFPAEADVAPLWVVDLRCEHLTDPLGIDDLQPRLSWRLAAAREGVRGNRQSAERPATTQISSSPLSAEPKKKVTNDRR